MFHMPGPGFGGWHHGPAVFGWLFFAIFLALMVVGVVVVIRLWRTGGFSAGRNPRVAPTDGALAELRFRYARGEMVRDEYLQRTHDLGAPPRGSPPWGPPSGPPPGTWSFEPLSGTETTAHEGPNPAPASPN